MSDNKRHVHAESMLEYAIDASKTDEPWLLWEISCYDSEWRTLARHPAWDIDVEYRRKPEMITVGKVSFPKPIDYKLEKGTGYWVADRCGTYYRQQWDDDDSDIELLKSGQLHLTGEAAEQHAQAIVKISKGEF
ncbi:hypothetical protein [Photorhabdus temperata]|uniref:Uncharacterized protein n=2 Tax=Photorhabdus temperata TaxID=574560 RepID=A0A081RQW3_PHOTE|nr:hypothetical protein [Photorhabdus temperata]KER01066.1 hypothetical protein MEG1DRAFT_04337 [Photorhabdus temperata subsp. temperata Meg1]